MTPDEADSPNRPEGAATGPVVDTVPDTEDLFCITCGYNVRGIPGDPRRCPECGYENHVADMRIPAGMIQKQAGKLETLPVVCVAWIFVALFALPLSASPSLGWTYGLIAAAVIVLGWGVCVYRYANSCEFRPGWGIILGEMHVAALGFIILIPSSVWSICMLYVGEWVLPISVFVLVALFCVIGVLAYLDARRRLVDQKRSLAVSLARRELERAQRHVPPPNLDRRLDS